jgi:protoheme IX farnesyltransferase
VAVEQASSVTGARLRGWGDTALAYLNLTKPRIIVLLLVTTIPAMILAHGGLPSIWLMAATVSGGAVVAGGANAVNCYFDRDIDEVMRRTRSRPLPSGRVEPNHAILFGVLLAGAGFLFLEAFTNLLAAFLTLGSFAFYVVVYTLLLKRTTPLNIVIGGASGAMPPVVGWAAVTGDVGLPALVLFGIIVVWTPPHFWALALNCSTDYESARVPMLPVVAGEGETRRQILLHSLGLVAVSLILWRLHSLRAPSLAAQVRNRLRGAVPVLDCVSGASVRCDGRGRAGRRLKPKAQPYDQLSRRRPGPARPAGRPPLPRGR